ncbi:hypothetical protein SASPL_152479 [Salvia splendens]|uniref:Apple domain-containing protein n=1 Tax=Salvia splendens TaxID=180675 RepID=A0A8X8W346_SALSN|nr:hypothetical protein SASPL_152479 [Salvia splendens]
MAELRLPLRHVVVQNEAGVELCHRLAELRLPPASRPTFRRGKAKMIRRKARSGHGTGSGGAGPDTSNDPTYYLSLQNFPNEVWYTEGIIGDSVLSMSRLNPNGEGVRSTWNNRTNSWASYTNLPVDNCDNYARCGPHGSCNAGTSPSCGCLDRFVPRDPESWGRADWSDGCVRRIALSCAGDKFLKYSAINLPDTRNTTYNVDRRSLAECQVDCSRDCSCVAYTQLNISGDGSGYLFYHGDLIDIRAMASSGQDLYIRIAASEPGDVASTNSNGRNRGRTRTIVIASTTSVVVMVFVCLIFVYVLWPEEKELSEATHVKEGELPFFSLPKGVLEDGQEIAVKRLSKTSSQGVNELRNELMLID